MIQKLRCRNVFTVSLVLNIKMFINLSLDQTFIFVLRVGQGAYSHWDPNDF